MMNDLLVVLSNPHDGRHEEFNDWYTNIHIRDVMRIHGTSAVQRLRLAGDAVAPGPGIAPDRAFDYMALYEVYDAERCSAGHSVCFSPMMLISDSFDFMMREAYYTPSIARNNRNGPADEGDYVLERIPAQSDPGFARWYADVRMPALMDLPGIVTGRFASIADHQMLEPNPDSHFIAVYRTADRRATLGRWHDAPSFPNGVIAQVACYTPIMDRLTAYDVRHASPEARLAEAKARVAIGDRVHRGFPEGLLEAPVFPG